MKNLNIKKFIKTISILFAISFLGLMLFATGAQLGAQYVSQTAQAEKKYKISAMQLCLHEKSLAQSKLLDAANGIALEKDQDLNDLNRKAKQTCLISASISGAVLSLSQNTNGTTVHAAVGSNLNLGSNVPKAVIEGAGNGQSHDRSLHSSDKASGKKVIVTSYNPVVGQTDASPCVGAAGTNICEKAKIGQRVVAVSQDLRRLYPMGSQIRLESSNPSIRGCYVVQDVMNKRYTNRVDLFFLKRSQNQGGEAVLYSNC